MRILAAQINTTVGDLKGNTAKILAGISKAKQVKADLVLFPELCLTGYPPEDFLLMPHFIEAVQKQLQFIVEASQGISVIVGTTRLNPSKVEKPLYNSAAIINNGALLGFQDKSLLPTYDVFDERRYFEPASEQKIWQLCGKTIGITICEDIWKHSEQLKDVSYRFDPIVELKIKQPDLVLNLSSSPYSFNKPERRRSVCIKAATTLGCPLILCNQVGGNDSLIFDGHTIAVSYDGIVFQQALGFQEDWLLIDLEKKRKPISPPQDKTADLYQALSLGVRDYFFKSKFNRACLGMSGGIDSALVASIAVDALGKENVLGICMPSRYSSEGSVTDSKKLAQNLGINLWQIPIEDPFQSYLKLLTPYFENLPPDATEENLQARIRGMILMAISNKLNYIVLSTGNKSELAMGYSTLYGDMCGGLSVISDLTKAQVYSLAKWVNRQREIIPHEILIKPPSAELRPNQKDTDSLPDYAIVDTVLQAYVEEYQSAEEISKKNNYPLIVVEELIQRIHRNEYKRRQSAPGLRISEKAFSIGRRFPIVQRWV